MRRLSILLFLYVSLTANALGQPENDLCANAISIPLGQVLSCPNDTPVEVEISGSTLEATPTQPTLRLSDPSQGIHLNSPGADVWYQFTAIANRTLISVSGGLEQPILVLFQGDACNTQYPTALQSGAAGSLSTTLDTRTEPGGTYFLFVSSEDFGAAGDFNLKVKSENDCSDCGERRGQLTVQPTPVSGTFETGQEVTFCYTPSMWSPGFSLEWLHGLDIDFGAGWDLTTLVTSAPAACTAPDGAWGWYESWESCNTNTAYGPGFAFDSKRGLLCPGGSANDGLPGNNFGDGPCGNLEPAPLDLEFCWTVQVKSTFSNEAEANLNIDIQMLGDGNSGSWMMASCDPEVTTSFFATAVPPVNAQPSITVLQSACPALCNGQVSLSSGSNTSYSLYGPDGQVVFSGNGPILNTIVSDLCPGAYQFVIQGGSGTQSISLQVPAVDLPDLSVDYSPACFEADPYQLLANLNGSPGSIAYNWAGPDNFTSDAPNPTVQDTGTYTLETTFNDCPIPVATLEVENVLPELNCVTTESSITFSWSESPTDTAYTPTLLSGQLGQLIGSHAFRVNNLAPGESATLELAVEGLDGCPLKVVEKTCTTNTCPQPDAGPDTLLCGSGGMALSIEAEAGATISWVPSTGLSCTDCTDPIAEPAQTTTYQVTVTDAMGCVGTDFVTIYVDEVPGDAIPDAPQAFCPGEPFNICLPEANNYLWISPIGFIQTGDCLTFPYTSPSIAGTYTLRVRLPNGCRVTEAIELAVAPECTNLSAPAMPLAQGGSPHLLQVFPNPADHQVQIRTNQEGPKSFYLRSIDGRLINQLEHTAMQITFDLNGLSQGTYVVEMVGASGAERQLLSVH